MLKLFSVTHQNGIYLVSEAAVAVAVAVAIAVSAAIAASDLRPRHSENRMMKYADDTYVLVGSAMVHTVTDEFNNIQSWAVKNNLKIHPSKTKQIISSRRRSKVQYPFEPFIPGAERVGGRP